MVDKTPGDKPWDRQPRWPAGTPTGPTGPGGGRFRDAGPGVPGGSGGGWAEGIARRVAGGDAGDVAGQWDDAATRYLQDVEGLNHREIDQFWERAMADRTADPEQWAADELLRLDDMDGGPERPAIEGDWADGIAHRLPGAAAGGDDFDRLPDHPHHPGARVIDSATLALDSERFGGGGYEIYNPETGEWETFVDADFDERGGVDYIGIVSTGANGEWSGFTTSDEPDFEGDEDDEEYKEEYEQAVQAWEEDDTREVAIRRRGDGEIARRTLSRGDDGLPPGRRPRR